MDQYLYQILISFLKYPINFNYDCLFTYIDIFIYRLAVYESNITRTPTVTVIPMLCLVFTMFLSLRVAKPGKVKFVNYTLIYFFLESH